MKRYIQCQLTLETREEYKLLKLAVLELIFLKGEQSNDGRVLVGIHEALLAHESV